MKQNDHIIIRNKEKKIVWEDDHDPKQDCWTLPQCGGCTSCVILQSVHAGYHVQTIRNGWDYLDEIKQKAKAAQTPKEHKH